jgi:glycosyltransferase involved in cell wall biosynthesis
MNLQNIAILHYSSAPVVGGVESVMQAHATLFLEMGFCTRIVAGKGTKEAQPAGAEFIEIPEMDSQNPEILQINQELEEGRIPENFNHMVETLVDALTPIVNSNDQIIVHNIFTKHFNLPLTAALFRLLDQGRIRHCIAWCHDFTWTSPNSGSKVHSGYPWDLLRTHRPEVTYVTISQDRQQELAGLFGCPSDQIRVIYNGVDPGELLGMSDVELSLISRLDLWNSDLNLLMPIRITQAKNIELAIHVVAELKKQGVRIKLVVTGPPDPHNPSNMKYFLHLQILCEQLGVRQEVKFIYESGLGTDKSYVVDMSVIGSLFRVSDALFMPSHREGFGMPILEAGLIGMPVFCADTIPAAKEIGGEDVIVFASNSGVQHIAGLIQTWMNASSVHHLRRRVRQRFLWRRIFQQEILRLLEGNSI